MPNGNQYDAQFFFRNWTAEKKPKLTAHPFSAHKATQLSWFVINQSHGLVTSKMWSRNRHAVQTAKHRILQVATFYTKSNLQYSSLGGHYSWSTFLAQTLYVMISALHHSLETIQIISVAKMILHHNWGRSYSLGVVSEDEKISVISLSSTHTYQLHVYICSYISIIYPV